MAAATLAAGRWRFAAGLTAAALLGLSLSSLWAQDAAAPADSSAPSIRIVACDAKVPSRKRGVCANQLSPEDFRAFAPGVSWYYNWHFKTDSLPPADVSMQFVPQVWSNQPEALQGLQDYLQSAPVKPRVVLAVNEPNLKGQAFITPQETAELYQKVKAIAAPYGIPVAGPNMALGSSSEDSITAPDPVENKPVTYTFMVPFLKAFFSFMGEAQVDALGFHSYGNFGEMKWASGELYKDFNKPIWVTEYAQWKTNSQEEAVNYLLQATDYLESCPFVQGYAWFKERANNNPSITLLAPEPGKLTALGQAYVALPPHDADLYYRIPGRLQAENYVAAKDAVIRTTTDADGVFDMASNGTDSTLDYNLQVDTAGTYTLSFRVMGQPGPIEVTEKDQTLGSVANTQPTWDNVQVTVPLPAGPQTLRVHFAGRALNWIEFSGP